MYSGGESYGLILLNFSGHGGHQQLPIQSHVTLMGQLSESRGKYEFTSFELDSFRQAATHKTQPRSLKATSRPHPRFPQVILKSVLRVVTAIVVASIIIPVAPGIRIAGREAGRAGVGRTRRVAGHVRITLRRAVRRWVVRLARAPTRRRLPALWRLPVVRRIPTAIRSRRPARRGVPLTAGALVPSRRRAAWSPTTITSVPLQTLFQESAVGTMTCGL